MSTDEMSCQPDKMQHGGRVGRRGDGSIVWFQKISTPHYKVIGNSKWVVDLKSQNLLREVWKYVFFSFSAWGGVGGWEFQIQKTIWGGQEGMDILWSNRIKIAKNIPCKGSDNM